MLATALHHQPTLHRTALEICVLYLPEDLHESCQPARSAQQQHLMVKHVEPLNGHGQEMTVTKHAALGVLPLAIAWHGKTPRAACLTCRTGNLQEGLDITQHGQSMRLLHTKACSTVAAHAAGHHCWPAQVRITKSSCCAASDVPWECGEPGWEAKGLAGRLSSPSRRYTDHDVFTCQPGL